MEHLGKKGNDGTIVPFFADAMGKFAIGMHIVSVNDILIHESWNQYVQEIKSPVTNSARCKTLCYLEGCHFYVYDLTSQNCYFGNTTETQSQPVTSDSYDSFTGEAMLDFKH